MPFFDFLIILVILTIVVGKGDDLAICRRCWGQVIVLMMGMGPSNVGLTPGRDAHVPLRLCRFFWSRDLLRIGATEDTLLRIELEHMFESQFLLLFCIPGIFWVRRQTFATYVSTPQSGWCRQRRSKSVRRHAGC